MKSGLAWLLGLSLCANGALLAARWRSGAPPPSGPAADAGLRSLANARGIESAVDSVSASALGGTSAVAASGPALWSTLDLGDLKSVAAVLRASGLPEEDVRVVVNAMIDDRFKARFEAIEAREYARPFWNVRAPGAGAEWSRRYSESYALWREAEAMKRDLFGPEPLGPMELRNLQGQFGPLSVGKLQALMQLDRDYQDLGMQVRSFGSGPPMPWENEQAAFVEAEKRRDVEALLSAEELAIYDRHTSGIAQDMRRQLAGFAPSEAEFLALFAVQTAHGQAHNLRTPPMSTADLVAAEKAKPQLLEQIRSTLGEERFKEYERATDPGFQAAFNVTRRLNLPRENATAAYALAEDTRAAVKALNRDTALTAADRAAAMGRVLETANAQLDTLLTRSGASVYRMRSSQWRYVESERAQKEREAK